MLLKEANQSVYDDDRSNRNRIGHFAEDRGDGTGHAQEADHGTLELTRQ